MNEKIKELHLFVDSMAGWWGDGSDKFKYHGEIMIKKGIDIELVKIILSDLYYAVANEFGG